MVPEIKAKWLAKLRDERTKQGGGGLRNDGFCCLGVLCEVHREENPELTWVKWSDRSDSYMGAWRYLPDAVVEWAGLPNSDPKADLSRPTLSYLNDKGYPFAKIADWIEEYL